MKQNQLLGKQRTRRMRENDWISTRSSYETNVWKWPLTKLMVVKAFVYDLSVRRYRNGDVGHNRIYLAVRRCRNIETDKAKYHGHESSHARKRVNLKKGQINRRL